MKRTKCIALPASFIAAGVLLLLGGSAQGETARVTNPATPEPIRNQGYQLVWQDDFDGPAGSPADPKRWNHFDLGKRHDVFNVEEACRLDGHGHLVITIRHHNKRVETGGVTSVFAATHGYFECRCQFQHSKGLWSAFWLMPSGALGMPETMNTLGVEIDVHEHLVKAENVFRSTIHWGGYDPAHHQKAMATMKVPKLGVGFHTIAVRWDERGYFFYADGQHAQRVEAPVSNVPEYMLLTCEGGKVGTSNWAGDLGKAKLPDSFVIDWVRVWQTPAQQAADQKRKAQKAPENVVRVLFKKRSIGCTALQAQKPAKDARPKMVGVSGYKKIFDLTRRAFLEMWRGHAGPERNEPRSGKMAINEHK